MKYTIYIFSFLLAFCGSLLAQRKEILIDSVEVIGEKLKREILGKKKQGKKKGLFTTIALGPPEISIARYFPNPQKKIGIIKEITLLVHNEKDVENKFNVQIYTHNNCMPDSALSSPIKVIPHKKDGWQTIKLDKPIKIPENGFWVAIEYKRSTSDFVNMGDSIAQAKLTSVKLPSLSKKGNPVYGHKRDTGIPTTVVKDYSCHCARRFYNNKEKRLNDWISTFPKYGMYYCPRIRVEVKW